MSMMQGIGVRLLAHQHRVSHIRLADDGHAPADHGLATRELDAQGLVRTVRAVMRARGAY